MRHFTFMLLLVLAMAQTVSAADKTVTLKAKGLFTGEVPITVTQTENGSYLLYDPVHNLYTIEYASMLPLDSLAAKGLLGEYFPGINFSANPTKKELRQLTNMVEEEQTDLSRYLQTGVATDADGQFTAYRLKSIRIDKLQGMNMEGKVIDFMDGRPIDKLLIYMYYGQTDISYYQHAFRNVSGSPMLLEGLSDKAMMMPRRGGKLMITPYRLKEGLTDFGPDPTETADFALVQMTVTPDESGVAVYESDDTKVTVSYEPCGSHLVDIHYYMGKTLDFYKNTFGRDSYDGQGGAVYNVTYYPSHALEMMALLYDNTPNIMGEARSLADSPYDQPEATERLEIYKYQNGAFAVSEYNPYLMNFGMGCYMKPYDAFMKPAGELSVMCHEFTHLINRKTANLGSNNDETGALNESFSDLMAISMAKSAEYGYGPQTPWLVGGHDFISGHSCLRNMAEPKKGLDGKVPGCDTYKGENWKDDKYAMAGVQNKFYCLLCDGGSGTNDHGYAYAMEGIGVEKGCQIAYLTLTKYASADSDYADIRRCFLAAAAELYGQGSAEVTAVGQAWDAVGVYENGVQPTGISAVSQSGQYKSAHAVFDLQGRQVSQSSAGQVKPGLYIRNGKKYVAR